MPHLLGFFHDSFLSFSEPGRPRPRLKTARIITFSPCDFLGVIFHNFHFFRMLAPLSQPSKVEGGGVGLVVH